MLGNGYLSIWSLFEFINALNVSIQKILKRQIYCDLCLCNCLFLESVYFQGKIVLHCFPIHEQNPKQRDCDESSGE